MTNIKRIDELTTEELRKVFQKNTVLQEEVSEDMQESELFWVGEVLDALNEYGGLSSWYIGFCNRNQHIAAKDGKEWEFIEGVKKAQKEFGFLPEGENVCIDYVSELIDELHDLELYSDEYYALEEKVAEHISNIERLLTDQFTKNLDGLLGTYEEDYFIEFYADARMNGDYYVNMDTFELFEDVSYTKSYV